MNISELITRIKIECGVYSIALPIENPNELIKDVIQNITLKTFSIYCPYYVRERFDLHSLQRLEKHSNYETYLLPDIFSERELLGIREVSYDESDISAIGFWGGGVPILHGNMINQAMLSNAGMSLANRMMPRLTFKYEHPRKITLYNVMSSCKLVFELALSHDVNLASITPTSEESFYDLALLDVKNALYQLMKHHTDISSAYGNISLKLDDWAQASDARKALLEEWGNTYHMDVMPFMYA